MDKDEFFQGKNGHGTESISIRVTKNKLDSQNIPPNKEIQFGDEKGFEKEDTGSDTNKDGNFVAFVSLFIRIEIVVKELLV